MISSTARRLSTSSSYVTHGRPSEKALLRKARERRDLQHRKQEFDMARRRESRRHSRRSSIQQDRCHRIAVWLLLPNVVMIILGCVMTLCSYFEAIGFGTIFWQSEGHNVFQWLGPLVLLGGCVAMFVNYMLYKRSRTGIYRLVSKQLSLPYTYDQMSHRGSCCHSTSASFLDPTSSVAPCSTRSSFSLPRSPGSFTASASMWSATGSHLAVKATPSGLSENEDISDEEAEADNRKTVVQSQDSSAWRAFSLDVVSWQEGRPDLDPAEIQSAMLSPRDPSQGYHEDLRSPQFFTGKFKSIFAFEDPRLAEVQFAEDIRGFPDSKKDKKAAKHKRKRQDNADKVEQRPLLEEKLVVDIPTEWIAQTDFPSQANNQRAPPVAHGQHELQTGNRSRTDLSEVNPGPSHQTSSHTKPSSSKQSSAIQPYSHRHGASASSRESIDVASPTQPLSEKDSHQDLEQFRQGLTELLMSNETICHNILRDVILKLKTNIDMRVKESPESGDASALHEMALRTLCSSKDDEEIPPGCDEEKHDEVEAIVNNAVEEAVQDYLVKALVEPENLPSVSSDQVVPDVKNLKEESVALPDICRSTPAPGTSGESLSPRNASTDTLSDKASDKDWLRPISPGKQSNMSSSSDVTKETKSQSASFSEEFAQYRRNKGVHFQIGEKANDVRPRVKRNGTPRLQRALAVDIKEKPRARYTRSKSQEPRPLTYRENSLTVREISKSNENSLNVPKSPLTYREKAQRARARMRHQLRPSMSMPVTSSVPWGLPDATVNAPNNMTKQQTELPTTVPPPPPPPSKRCASLEEHADHSTSRYVLHALKSFPSIQADDIRISRRQWSRHRSASEGERRSVLIAGERTSRNRRTRSLEHRHSSGSFSVDLSEPQSVSAEKSDAVRAFNSTADAVFTENYATKKVPEKVNVKLPEQRFQNMLLKIPDDKIHDTKLPKIESIDSYFRSRRSTDTDFPSVDKTDNFLRPKYSPAARRRSRSTEVEYSRPREGLLQTSL